MQQKIVGVTELQRRFCQFFDQGAKKNTPIILARGSQPEAVLVFIPIMWGRRFRAR